MLKIITAENLTLIYFLRVACGYLNCVQTGRTMKKLLLIAVLITVGQVHAKEFIAGGMRPFWMLSLRPQHGSQYQAVLSYLNASGAIKIKAVVTKTHHKDYATYQGQGSNGKPLSIMIAGRPCVTEGNRNTWSHLVIVNEFKGCGGNELINMDHNKQIDKQSGRQTTHEKAQQLNMRGYHLYKQGRYKQALSLFHRATQANNRYALAQYNLACTAAIMARRNQCFQDEKLSELLELDRILTALKQSIKFDAKRKNKSQTDPDLARVRKTYQYYRDILRYSPNNDDQLRQMLKNINWQQAAGFYPHHGKLANIKFDSSSFFATDNKGRKKTGHYSLDNGLITLTFTSSRQKITGRLLDNNGAFRGVLRFSGAAKANILPFDEYTSTFKTPNCAGNQG